MPDPRALSPIEADIVYDVLVEHAGEVDHHNGDERATFIRHQTSGHCVEYRFMGSLGFGGKFWNNNGWYVTCYSEDLTPERDAAIKATNAVLAELYRTRQAAEAEARRV